MVGEPGPPTAPPSPQSAAGKRVSRAILGPLAMARKPVLLVGLVVLLWRDCPAVVRGTHGRPEVPPGRERGPAAWPPRAADGLGVSGRVSWRERSPGDTSPRAPARAAQFTCRQRALAAVTVIWRLRRACPLPGNGAGESGRAGERLHPSG